jgi:signal transduction histidine kinase
VSEALSNAAKHAHVSMMNAELGTNDAILQLAIRDDGIGGADPSLGSRLIGLSDRIAALGGTLQITSPTGNGTTVLIEFAFEAPADEFRPSRTELVSHQLASAVRNAVSLALDKTVSVLPSAFQRQPQA